MVLPNTPWEQGMDLLLCTIGMRITGTGRCVRETHSLADFLKYSPLNYGPLSDITSVGIPWRASILLRWVTTPVAVVDDSFCYFHKPGNTVNHQHDPLSTEKDLLRPLSKVSQGIQWESMSLWSSSDAQMSHFSSFVWRYSLRPGHQTDCLKRSWHLAMPRGVDFLLDYYYQLLFVGV